MECCTRDETAVADTQAEGLTALDFLGLIECSSQTLKWCFFGTNKLSEGRSSWRQRF